MKDYNAIPEIELRYTKRGLPEERLQLSSSHECYKALKTMFNSDTIEYREEFLCILLDKGYKTLGFFKVSSGGMISTVVDPRMIFAAALKAAATGIILAHNHPSGNLKPSEPDIAITRRLKQGGEILGINILDHLIISPSGYYSFNDEGML